MPPLKPREEIDGEVMYLGIDPGASGGIAVHSVAGIISVGVMPSTEADIWELVNAYNRVSFAIIEWIHPAIQGVGKSSMSKLYGNYKALRMALTAAEIRFEDVQPRKWQQAMGISQRGKTETTTQWKNRLKARAQQLFPSITVTLATADALLIAEYCKRFREGTLR